MIRLPQNLPILPIKDSLLLPGGQITKKLFEPHYINMVLDSLAGHDRFVGICIIDETKKSRAKDVFYNIGCVGRITSFEEMVDGSFSVVLTGYCRFELGNEIPTMRKYRYFEVGCDKYESDLIIDPNPNIDKNELVKIIRIYTENHAIDMDFDVLPDTPAFNLVAFFSMHLPFSDKDRQKLLEARTVEDRAGVLSNYMKALLDI